MFSTSHSQTRSLITTQASSLVVGGTMSDSESSADDGEEISARVELLADAFCKFPKLRVARY